MDFADRLCRWFLENKRDMPWRLTRDPYRIWVSEIMLQQTQVDTVIPYYERFMERFSDLETLAGASLEEVLALWQGLGYYKRAENLHRGARYIMEQHGGRFPDDPAALRRVPGIGAYTAGAILSIAFGVPAAAVDGNVMRVLSRVFLMEEDVGRTKSRAAFESRVRQLIKGDPGIFNQAMMELGALICTPKSPRCQDCPVSSFCQAHSRHVEEQYPVKTQKPKPLTEQYQVLVIRRGGRYWMEKRPQGGLLAELWGFPLISEEQWTAVESRVNCKRCLKRVCHVFTHRRWELNPVLMELEDGKVPEFLPINFDVPPDRGGFFTLEQMRQLPVPTAFRKIIRQLDDRDA